MHLLDLQKERIVLGRHQDHNRAKRTYAPYSDNLDRIGFRVD